MLNKTKLLSLLFVSLLFPTLSRAQGARITADPIALSGSGRPVGGANVAVCAPLATTAAVGNGTLLTFTMASNPITAGFASGGTLLVAGFTAGDTALNAGTISGNVITGGYTVITVSSTSIVVASSLVITAATNGTILQMGTSTIPCGALATLYTDASLATTTTNPIRTDGLGNYGAGIVGGTYYTQIYGSGITTSIRQFVTGSGSGLGGTIATGQIAFATAPNTIGGDADFLWDTTNKFFTVGPPTASFDPLVQPSLDTGFSEFRAIGTMGGRINVANVDMQVDPSTAGGGFWNIDLEMFTVNTANAALSGDLAGGVSSITAAGTGNVTNATGIGDNIGASPYFSGFQAAAYLEGAGAHLTNLTGLQQQSYLDSVGGSVWDAYGVFSSVDMTQPGTATNIQNYISETPIIVGGSTVTNYFGYRSKTMTPTGGGAATNTYAYYSDNQGTSAGHWSFYAAGGRSWFTESAGTESLNVINPTASTNGANQSSPLFKVSGTYWDGAVSQTDLYSFEDVVGAGANPTTTLVLTHTGSPSGGGFTVPQLTSANSVVAGGIGSFGSNVLLYGNTPATAISNFNFGALKIEGNYWDGAASQLDDWSFTGLLGAGANPASTMTLSHTGTSGVSTFSLPVKMALTIATGTAPFAVTSTTPVANLTTVPTTYNHSGTQQTSTHLVVDSCTLGTDCAITLAGSAVYTSSTSYSCVAQDSTATNATAVAQASGSSVTITGTGVDVIRYACVGN